MSPTLTIDLDALAANLASVRRQIGGAEVAPVVKADAYGLGAPAISRRLWAEGARSFFVARIAEGEVLRSALGFGRQADIYVLDGAGAGEARRLTAAGLTPVLNSLAQLEAYAAQAGVGPALPAALMVDTGMNRLGLRLEEAAALAGSTDRLRRLDLKLVLSHLACAELPDHPLNAAQLARFREVRALFPEARASLANSAGCWLGADYAFDLVRPGISLYGGGPRGAPDPAIAAVATLTAPVLQVRAVAPGESVGYGASYTAAAPTRVAVLAAGYADGVLRSRSGHGYAHVAGQRRPLLGRVSMDLLALDVTGLDVAPGDAVQLLGPDVPLDEVAFGSGTIAHEILTGLGVRVPRRMAGATG